MSVLSDKTIRALLATGKLQFIPTLLEKQIQPASIDLRLGNSFKTMLPGEAIDTHKELPKDLYQTQVLNDGQAFILQPFSFVLATTKDYMVLPDNIGGNISGRSSIGRLGSFVENAGWVDPGFAGEITMELFNASPRAIILYVGDRICQIELMPADEMPEHPYRGKYQGQTGATASLVYKDHA